MTSLYLAPHLDDVALSCAGGLLARLAAGRRVVVCTFFTEDGPVGAARRREDAAALASIGAEARHLGFADAPRRLGVAPSFRALARSPVGEGALARELEATLGRLVRELTPAEVWLPLGVGGHVDHRLVFAARGAAGAAARFYEERPYAFVPALRTLRRLELTGGRLSRPPGPRALARAFTRGRCGALLSGGERDAFLAELAARIAGPHVGERLALSSTRVRFGRGALARAAALIERYPSQTRWLFGDEAVRVIWRDLAGAPGGGFYERSVALRAGPAGPRGDR